MLGGLKAAASRFAQDTRGATAVEYGMLAALLAVAIIGGMNSLGASNNGSWGKTADKVGKAMGK